MTPKYDQDTGRNYKQQTTYYHTTPASWWADVEAPNKAVKPVEVKAVKPIKKRIKKKTVIRFKKLRPGEISIIKFGILLLILKLIIFGL